MKMKKYLLPILIALCLVLSGCEEGNKPAAGVDSEKAMENFLNKLDEGNYVMEAKDYLRTTVSSKDQVVFEYAEDMYTDFAVMSLNSEVFQGVLDGDKVDEIRFVCDGQAIDAAKKKLPNAWIDLSDGNIWNLFYNIQEEPLKFVSYDDSLKQNVLALVGYGENLLRLMHEVYLELDSEDPSTARIQAEMDEDMVARISPDDVDIQITFGSAQSNPAADAWLNNPSYPEARDGWNETDEFIFNSVFLPGYGLEAIPFPTSSSYALTVDEENFVMDDEVYIRDSHASKQDIADYAAKLIAEGFSEVKETAEDGSEKTYYRKLLREAYKCYSSICLEYNDGMDLTAKKYYDCPAYDNLDDINKVIKAAAYPELEDSENFTSYLAKDKANEMTESWLCFFSYDLGLYVDIDYQDYEETMNYLKAYEETLAGEGFTPVKAEDEDEADYYASPNGFCSFRYNFAEDGKVSLLFKSEKYISPSEAEKMIADAGFPKVGLSEPITCRDLREFRKIRYGTDMKAYITVSQEYESAEKAEAFLSGLEAALNKDGFDRENPDVVGSLKQIVIYNEAKGMYVGIDYFPEQAQVNLDFVAE